MKSTISAGLLGLLLCGCSTVQVARLDTTLPKTTVVDLYKHAEELKGKTYQKIGYLAYGKPVTEENQVKALGAMLNKARQIGAEGLILERESEDFTNTMVLRGTAIIYGEQ